VGFNTVPRNVEIVQGLSPVLSLVAVALLATRRRLIERLRGSGATGPASATSLSGASAPARWWTRRLLGAGVIGASADGRYWLIEEQWQRYRAARRRRALTIVACLLIGLALMIGLGVVRL